MSGMAVVVCVGSCGCSSVCSCVCARVHATPVLVVRAHVVNGFVHGACINIKLRLKVGAEPAGLQSCASDANG